MKTAKFTVPVSALTGFLEYINTKGLKSTIALKKENMYTVKVSYTKEQIAVIAELQELINELGVLFLVGIKTQIDLITIAMKNPPERSASLKTFNWDCLLKAFASKMVK